MMVIWHDTGPHATCAWLGLSEDEGREAEASADVDGWPPAAGYAQAQKQLERHTVHSLSIYFRSFAAWFKATLNG